MSGGLGTGNGVGIRVASRGNAGVAKHLSRFVVCTHTTGLQHATAMSVQHTIKMKALRWADRHFVLTFAPKDRILPGLVIYFHTFLSICCLPAVLIVLSYIFCTTILLHFRFSSLASYPPVYAQSTYHRAWLPIAMHMYTAAAHVPMLLSLSYMATIGYLPCQHFAGITYW